MELGISRALKTALELVLLLKFRVFQTGKGKWNDMSDLLMLAGSLWFMFLQSRATRRGLYLLSLIDRAPWESGWQALWRSPCLYWIFPFPLRKGRHGTLLYVGQTEDFSRRFSEHMSRLLDSDGYTQQPFYRYARMRCATNHELVTELCFWMMIPVRPASVHKQCRLIEESQLVKLVGSLNPPLVYDLFPSGRKKAAKGTKIFDRKRSLCRLRGPKVLQETSRCCTSRCLLRRDWRDGLAKTASALAGHKFAGADAASLAAWNLAPGAWAFVARRIDQFEEGWRRRRGLNLLRKISHRRRDLCPLLSEIHIKMPWPGSEHVRDELCNSVRRLLASWRSDGKWIPVLRHAKCFVSWMRSRTIADVLSNGGMLRKHLNDECEPACNCKSLLARFPSWPAVTFEGELHIAAPQGCAIWPEHLQCLMRWPANLSLPPRWEDVASAVRDSFRRLRNRCKVPSSCAYVDIETHSCISLIWNHVQSSSAGPVSWAVLDRAKQWIAECNFFVSVFDHNLSTLALVCPKLAYRNACHLLDFGPYAHDAANLVWKPVDDAGVQQLLKNLCTVPGLPGHLSPCSLATVPRSSWRIGSVSVLPKWKAPGVKWRLIVNKHSTPCCGLHSFISRAVDVLLDNFPIHLWTDYLSMSQIMSMVQDFNSRSTEFGFDRGVIIAADMQDCFRHLPVELTAEMWDALANYWVDRGVAYVSIPAKRLNTRGVLGFRDEPHWRPVSSASVRCVLVNFVQTKFILVGKLLGTERQGAPQGDALSSALLRLWKWFREYSLGKAHMRNAVVFPNSKCKLVHLCTRNFLLLDVSYRDDLRMFCVWKSSGGLGASVIEK